MADGLTHVKGLLAQGWRLLFYLKDGCDSTHIIYIIGILVFTRKALGEALHTERFLSPRKDKNNICIVMKYLLDYFFLFAYIFKLILETTYAQARSI